MPGCDGVLLKFRGEGDSTMSVFSRASDAVQAAFTAQRSLLAEQWPAETPIRVRVAVHTGEAIERDGDYFGPAVNRSARLRSLVRAGQVLLSQSTAALVADHLDEGLELVGLGEQPLRGMSHDLSRSTHWSDQEFASVIVQRSRPPRRRQCSIERGVTRKEREVLAAVAERLSNPEIAERLYVSRRTVESHISSLLRKLDASNRRDLAARRTTFSARPTIHRAQRRRCCRRTSIFSPTPSAMWDARPSAPSCASMWSRAL